MTTRQRYYALFLKDAKGHGSNAVLQWYSSETVKGTQLHHAFGPHGAYTIISRGKHHDVRHIPYGKGGLTHLGDHTTLESAKEDAECHSGSCGASAEYSKEH